MNAIRTVELEDGSEVALPMVWVICADCQGDGKSSAYLGAFTGEDMADDPEFAADYMAGAYDKPCACCNGRGSVQEVDAGRLADMPQDVRDAYDEACESARDSRAAWDSEAPLRYAEGH